MPNMELITSVTVGAGGAASVTLPATGTIPATYTDLKLVYSARATVAGTQEFINISFNGNTSNYSLRSLQGDGSAASSNAWSFRWIGYAVGSTATASTFSNGELYIPNYRSSNFKSFSGDNVAENNTTNAQSIMTANLWSDTAAITSIALSVQGGSDFVEGSTFYLYGISNVTSTTKATGGIVSSDGTYNYHMFPYSGTFTPTTAISADVLVIAGGGGGGGFSSGQGAGAGGGAGGLCYQAGRSLTAGVGLTVTVGAGGNAGTGSANPTAGGNSTLGTITALGGGYGASHFSGGQTGGSGGSGGGASEWAGNHSGGTATQGNSDGATGYGNNGGANSNLGGGAGGGAGGIGGTASGNTGGAGGLGFTNSVITAMSSATGTGVNSKYAGGGGGGAGFTGSVASTGGTAEAGGGIGGNSSGGTPIAGRVNTGGGGGGAPSGTGGGTSGGSGIVIIRYAI